MKYVFDTDHITFLQRPRSREHAAIVRRKAARPAGDFGFTVVSFHEQLLGAHAYISRARTPAAVVTGHALLADLLCDYQGAVVLRFDMPAATEFDRQQAAGVRIGTSDLRIAAIALVNRLTLLTRNARDFGKVPGLVTEDWTT